MDEDYDADLDDFEDGDDRDGRYDDGWYDDDPWRDDDPYPEPNCYRCGDTRFTSATRQCWSCNPPAWLVRCWSIRNALSTPWRWLRRRLRRPRPHDDEWGPF